MAKRGKRFLNLKEEFEAHPFHEVSEHRREIQNFIWVLERNFDLLKDLTENVAEDFLPSRGQSIWQ